MSTLESAPIEEQVVELDDVTRQTELNAMISGPTVPAEAFTESREPELTEKHEYIPGMNWVLDQSQERTEPYTTQVLGKEFKVLPGVFSPEYFAETAWYTGQVMDNLNPGDAYLDLGCGAGVTTTFAALKGAKVTSLDINPKAVENTRTNAELHGVSDRVDVRQSDVYSALGPADRFNVIYWNMPFGYREPEAELTDLQRAVFDPGYEAHRKFITEARAHIKPGGILLMGISTTLGNLEAIQKFAAEAGVNFEQLGEMIDPDAEKDIRFQLLRAVI